MIKTNQINRNICSDEKSEDFYSGYNAETESVEIPKTSEKLNGTKLLMVDSKGNVLSCQWIKYAGVFAVLFFLVTTSMSVILFLKHSEAIEKSTELKKDLSTLKATTKRLANETHVLAMRIQSGQEALSAVADREKTIEPFQVKTLNIASATAEQPEIKEKIATITNPETIKRNLSEFSLNPSDIGTGKEHDTQEEKADETDAATAFSAALPPGDFNTGWVDADTLKITATDDQSMIDVSVKIRNPEKSGNDTISGYGFMILESGANPLDWKVLPPSPLKNGIPESVKKGFTFTISNYKEVKYTGVPLDPKKSVTSARVVVFNRSGERMLDKRFPILPD